MNGLGLVVAWQADSGRGRAQALMAAVQYGLFTSEPPVSKNARGRHRPAATGS